MGTSHTQRRPIPNLVAGTALLRKTGFMTAAAEPTWERIRATRWRAPAPAAADPDRRRAYGAALEQAEQLFRAAHDVGTETQPLLIFYGLSQAGRAIAAAALSSITDQGGWQLRGHGICSVSHTLSGPLSDIQIKTDKPGGTGSFVRLSALLGSPLWPSTSSVRFEEAWDCLPENYQWPLTDDDRRRRMPLYVDCRSVAPDLHTLASAPVAYFPPWVLNDAQHDRALVDYLAAFPEAQGFHSFRRAGNGVEAVPEFEAHADGWCELLMHWEMPEAKSASQAERQRHLKDLTRSYDEARYFFPAIGGCSRSIHPLMAWWVVLHTLSMLARYQPAEWAAHIDVDRSRAVAIEQLLRGALTSVPQLVAKTIEEVSS
ncbi:YaaC family protein [Spirillospora sp. CA-294931]|uniref:YaaC family protein n=1 Tax=Spirillospora sp. CA-294931 TaxID=3240042 RepID=UPI003D8E62C5